MLAALLTNITSLAVGRGADALPLDYTPRILRKAARLKKAAEEMPQTETLASILADFSKPERVKREDGITQIQPKTDWALLASQIKPSRDFLTEYHLFLKRERDEQDDEEALMRFL